MDIKAFLTEACAQAGVSGYEAQVSQYFADAFGEVSDEVSIDGSYNMIARTGNEGPRIYVTAHEDEIGLMVQSVEKDGCLRITHVGGVDGRILPAMPVSVYTREGVLPGVIGAKPPHLLTQADQKKTVQMKDLYIDVGLDYEEAVKRVRPGDPVALIGPVVQLEDGRLAGKTMDDRSCVASMLETARRLRDMRVKAQTWFVAASREEIWSEGAKTTCWALDPDVAIAIDVAHADTPDGGKFETCPLDKVSIGIGPFLHPELVKRLRRVAEENGIPYSLEISSGKTWTDADASQVSRAGVPSVLVSVPVKYMHTTVETLDERMVREVGRLVALFIEDLSRDWEAITWY